MPKKVVLVVGLIIINILLIAAVYYFPNLTQMIQRLTKPVPEVVKLQLNAGVTEFSKAVASQKAEAEKAKREVHELCYELQPINPLGMVSKLEPINESTKKYTYDATLKAVTEKEVQNSNIPCNYVYLTLSSDIAGKEITSDVIIPKGLLANPPLESVSPIFYKNFIGQRVSFRVTYETLKESESKYRIISWEHSTIYVKN